MPTRTEAYDYIVRKIQSMKETYPSLRSRTDSYVFSALCVKAHFYKNPALVLNEEEFDEIIVDGQYDGGVDILLSDPNAEGADFIIGQSKFYQTISSDGVLNAMMKMAGFYKDMLSGRYEQVNARVQRRFLTLNSEIGDESKIHFVFYTSAPKGRISSERLEKKFKEEFADSDAIAVSILFASDIEDEIRESESRRPTVESGKIRIDATGNYLQYGENAAIVNVSAYSIKQLYAQHNTNLLSRNLRYHIAGKSAGISVDKGIAETIRKAPESFWLKNNGITIICDDFNIDGKEVKLRNFSVVNGGQTTYMLHKSANINDAHDLYLPCKIIKTMGESDREKNAFSLEIAQAANSQKAIKPVDLKANSPEQVSFAQAMREEGVFYQTKRGEEVPRNYREPYKNTDLPEVGKLCLAAIFQLPYASRAKPSTIYGDKYYNPIFNGNQPQIAKICKELLYVDYYFTTRFRPKFDRENADSVDDSSIRISFAHNARTMCIAFVALAARYCQHNITDQTLRTVFLAAQSDSKADADAAYVALRDLGTMKTLLPAHLIANRDLYDKALDKLFGAIIEAGILSYSIARQYDSALTVVNFLKRTDKNYYSILKTHWSSSLKGAIKSALSNSDSE